MFKKAIFFLLIGIAAFLGSTAVTTPRFSAISMEKRYYAWQEKYLQDIEETTMSLKDKSELIEACILDRNECNQTWGLDKEVESILVYSGDKQLLYWSSPILPSPQVLPSGTGKVLWIENKPYILKQLFTVDKALVYYMSAPEKVFAQAFSIIPGKGFFKLEKKPSNYPMLDETGNVLFFFKLSSLPYTRSHGWLAIILYIISLLLLSIGIYYLIEGLFKNHARYRRVFYTIGAIILVRLITAVIFYRDMGSTLTDGILTSESAIVKLEVLWINILLFYACLILITKRIKLKFSKIEGKWSNFLVHSIVYLAIIASCILVAYVGKSIVFNSQLDYMLARLGEWDFMSFISLIALIIFIIAVFHLSWFLLKSLADIRYSLPNKILAMVAACIISLSIYRIAALEIHPFPFYLIVILFIFLLDLFVEEAHPSLNWLFIWVAVASACSTSLLYKYHIEKLNTEQESILFTSTYLHSLPASANGFAQPTQHYDGIDYAVYKNGKRIEYYGSFYPLIYPYDSTIPLKEINTFYRGTRYETIYRPDKQTTIVSSRLTNDIITPISWYAYIFVIWLILIFLLALLNTRFKPLPEQWHLRITQLPTLRRRIQLNIMLLTIVSFASVCLLSYIYLKNTASGEINQEVKNKLSILIDDIESGLNNNRIISVEQLKAEVKSKAELHRAKVLLYNKKGKLISSAKEKEKYRLNYEDWQGLMQADAQFIHLGKDKIREVISPIVHKSGTTLAFLGYDLSNNATNSPFNNFLNTLLKLYIFLGVIALGVALLVSNSITNPLRKLADKLKAFQLGKKNQRLEWKTPDELGELIQNYNSMIDELEASARMLAEQERDLAWREMAKQVAHEIKNPLTPMKLSIQHLQFTIAHEPERSHELINQVSETLIEQIDKLSRIASSFSNFAKLPSAENQKLSLNTVVTHVHDLFRKRRDMDIELKLPMNDVFVFADKDQMSRIVTNLLKNAIQAIPVDRKGRILITLYIEKNNAVISIKDNGIGIPADTRDKIFKPNFTSKNSGTGLGLAMCAKMVEGFNGKIRFETDEGIGTTFYVVIPLMHSEEQNRIYL